MGRHGEIRVKPGAKIAHFRQGLDVNCANTDRTRINIQQLLSRNHSRALPRIPKLALRRLSKIP